MMIRITRCLGLLLILVLTAAPLCAQEPADPLDIFKQFSGKVWLGHYSDSETSHFNHALRFTPNLDGKTIHAIKKVPELDFVMETRYFWDPGAEKIAYVALTNRGQLSKGTVSVEEGKLVLLGVSVEKSGNREYKMTLEVLSDGTLEDRFFLKRDGQWHQGHLIQYKETKEAEFVDLFN